MKSPLLSAAVLALFAIASCKKSEGGSDSWAVGSSTYSATTVTAKPATFNYTLVASDGNTSSPHTIVFFFNGNATSNATTPTAGTYKVVSSADAAGQVSFATNGSSPSNVYTSTGNDNISATVSVNGDKVSISMPKVWATGTSDSVQVSAGITQN